MGVLRRYSWGAGFLVLATGAGFLILQPAQRNWAAVLLTGGGFLVLVGALLNIGELAALVRGRGVIQGANAALYTLLVLLIVLAANFLAGRHRARVDLSEGHVHTLSPQTVRILEALDTDVEAVGFFTDDVLDRRTAFEDLAREYEHASPRFTLRLVDPKRSPGEALLNEIKQDGTIVIKTEKADVRITTSGEQELTGAILKLTKGSHPTACFTVGHGEFSTADAGAQGYAQAAEALRQDQFEIRDTLLLREEEVPGDCSIVVVAGPSTPLHASEAGRLERWLRDGGRLMVLKRDPAAVMGLDDLLGRYGLKANMDTVVDRLSKFVGGDDFIPVVTSYEAHPVTRALREQGLATFFPVASSLETLEPAEAGITSRLVARTTEAAWGETSQVASLDPGVDHEGPIGLVAVAEGPAVTGGGEGGTGEAQAASVSAEKDEAGDAGEKAPAPERRVVLFGDADFASNSYLRAGSSNADLFANAAAWLAEEEDLLSIRPAARQPRPITLTSEGASLLTAMTYLVPATAFVGAAFIWSRRRRL